MVPSSTHPLECRRATVGGERRLGIRGKSNPVQRNIIFWCSDDRSAWRWSSVGRNPWNPLIRWPSRPYYFWWHTLPPRSNSISSIWYHVGIGLRTYPNYNPRELLFARRRIIYLSLPAWFWLVTSRSMHADRCWWWCCCNSFVWSSIGNALCHVQKCTNRILRI